MLYRAYQLQDDFVAPLRALARALRTAAGACFWNLGESFGRPYAATLEMVSRFQLTHSRPDFGIDAVRVGNRDVPVNIEVALDLPFGKLLRFAKDIDTPQPRILVVAPLSGHFSTLLAGTVKTLL